MPICTRCGEQNADNVSYCNKCGVALGSQIRAKLDVTRGQNMRIVRIAAWIVAVIALAIVGPRIYHAANGEYLKYHLRSVTDRVTTGCDGPITENTPAYQKDQINTCLSTNSELQDAQLAYANFTKADKP